jgi:hypothetical protein
LKKNHSTVLDFQFLKFVAGYRKSYNSRKKIKNQKSKVTINKLKDQKIPEIYFNFGLFNFSEN